MKNFIRSVWALTFLLFCVTALAEDFRVSGRVIDTQGNPVSGATVHLAREQRDHQALTDTQGQFQIDLNAVGSYDLTVNAETFQPLSKSVELLSGDSNLDLQLIPLITRSDSVTVTADVNAFDVLSPDPAEKVYVRQDLLDANPGRPGAPVSIPGYPIETASSGIKAPQYFAPGVAGDHGEPIAQFIAVGTYLVPNNLSANAHGNGYSDPNIFIPEILESVQVDGGAYNVRQGNHSVNLAAIYGLRSHLDPFITLTGDYRDIDVVTGFSPAPESFVAVEASYRQWILEETGTPAAIQIERPTHFPPGQSPTYFAGDRILRLLVRAWPGANFSCKPKRCELSQCGGHHRPQAKRPDSYLARSGERHLAAHWEPATAISGFFRTYNLSLYSDFGQGLIRQSEFRTVTGQSTNYVNKLAEALSLLLGWTTNVRLRGGTIWTITTSTPREISPTAPLPRWTRTT